MSRVIAIMACVFSLAACSAYMPSMSFLKPSPSTSTEALRIESEPPGADAKTSQGQSCRTPCEMSVQTAGDLTVTLALTGYQPHTVTVRQEAPSATGPQDRDSVGSAPRLAPNPVYVELDPVPAMPPPKKPAVKKKAKPATAQAHPAPAPAAEPAPATTAAVPPMAPTTSTEPAASATQYPWPSSR